MFIHRWLFLPIACALFFPWVANDRAHAQDEDRVQQWIRQLSSTIDPQRIYAAGKLAQMGESAESATVPLLNCLADPNADVRLYAANALAHVSVDWRLTLDGLSQALHDRDEHVAYAAEWSMAKIAKRVVDDSFLESEECESLQQSLERGLTTMTNRPHQARHAEALNLAIQHLASLQPAQSEPKQPAPVVVETNSQPPAEQLAEHQQQFLSQFAAADRVQRLLLIEQIAEPESNPQLLRELLMRALVTDDFSVIEYIVERIGEPANQHLIAIYEALASPPPAWGSLLLSNMTPQSETQLLKLQQTIHDRQAAFDLRAAAMGAIGRASSRAATAAKMLIKAMQDVEAEADLRMLAVDALSELGPLDNQLLDQLLQLFESDDTPDLVRDAIARSLDDFAPKSPRVARLLVEVLKKTDINDYQYAQLASALGDTGPIAMLGLEQLIRGLASNEDHIRQACVEALEPLGADAAAAAPALAALITNPNVAISTKATAAAVMAKFGPTITPLLTAKINTSDATVREHILRSLAIIGANAHPAVSICLAKLKDPQEPLHVRTAAAVALGNIGAASQIAVDSLEQLAAPKTEVELRCAALVALTQIQPQRATSSIALAEEDTEFAVRLCAAFAKHLAGNSTASLESLMAMQDPDDENRSLAIEDAVLDLGHGISSILINNMRDNQTALQNRLLSARVYARLKPVDWQNLVDMLDDPMIGEDVHRAIVSGWEFEDELLPVLLKGIADQRTTTVAKARMLQLADYITDGLGAGGEEDSWPGFAVTRFAEPVADNEPSKASESSGGESIVTESAPAQIPEPAENRLSLEEAATTTLVKVFYGTNRQPLAIASRPNLTSGHGAAIGLAIAALATCTLGFLRRKSPHYTLAAITGLGAVSALAVRTIQFSDATVAENERVQYTGQYSDTVELGMCEVTIPKNHVPGELESPSFLLKLELSADPEKHVVLQKVKRLEPDQFYDNLQQEMEQRGDSILVFVHGYNVTFNDAARRTAQMAHDLKYPGAPVFYSWPSQANWYQYRVDQRNIEQSVGQIRQFLTNIAAKSKATSINLVAHSMGNVGLTAALNEMANKKQFNQIVLAAPDIDAETFKQDIAPKIVSKAKRITLYTSKTDLALIASRYFNKGTRAGDSGNVPVVFPGIETIDATAVDSSLLGHSYYGSNVDVLFDLGQLLGGKPIGERQYLRPAPDQPYWYFERQQTAKQTPFPLRR